MMTLVIVPHVHTPPHAVIGDDARLLPWDRALKLEKLNNLDCRGMPLCAPFWRRDVLIVPAFLALYLLLEYVSLVHQFAGLGLTLWNPPPALSLALLLVLGFRYVPVLFVAAILAGEMFQIAPGGWTAKVLTSAVLAGGYAVLALLLRALRADAEISVLTRTVHLLVVVPAGVLVIAVIYCSSLVLTDALPAAQLGGAVRHFWIGDTIGIVTLLPALLATLTVDVRRHRSPTAVTLRDAVVFVLGACVALAVIFGRTSTNEFQFFYLLFLPVIWMATRQGYIGAAFACALVHACLVVVIVRLGYDAADFMAFQMLMLALSATGLLLGAAMTERQLSERRLRAQQAEVQRISRIAAAGGMGATLAHQISQPLSTAATYVYVGRRQLATAQPDLQAVDESLGKALTEAQRAREILERVRDFVSVGRLQLAPVSLAESIRKMAAAWRSEAAERGVSIRIEATEVPLIQADSTQIEQVIVNLISNAVDAASERPGGAVVIRIDKAEGRRIRIEVEDNGPGISSDIAERLFEPFVTSKPRGMGLGVALSRRIIEAHGGRLWYEPVEPQGSRFVVALGNDPVNRHAS